VQFNDITEIYRRPTLVAMVTEICEFYEQNLQKLGLYVRYIRKSFTKHEVYEIVHLNSVNEVYSRLTLVAMVTK